MRVLPLALAAVVVLGCSPDSGPCAVRPNLNNDTCVPAAPCDAYLTIGYAYDGTGCNPVPGCACDDCCREKIAPFISRVECMTTCPPAR